MSRNKKLNRTQEVVGSSPINSTNRFDVQIQVGRRRGAALVMVSCAVAFAPGATTTSKMPVEGFHDIFTIWPAAAENCGEPGE